MNSETQYPGLMQGFVSVIKRDLLLALKRPGDILNPLFFFAMVSTLFPLAVGTDADTLRLIGPGVIWVAALLSTLLGLHSLFQHDYDDGSLEQLVLSPQPLPLLVLGKTIAHWILTGLPLLLVTPLIAGSYQLSGVVLETMVITLLPGTLSLSLLGSIGAALTVGLNRSNALLSLLILPMAMPILIFGARTVSLAASGDSTAAGTYFLAAYCMFAFTLAPFATAAALRVSNE